MEGNGRRILEISRFENGGSLGSSRSGKSKNIGVSEVPILRNLDLKKSKLEGFKVGDLWKHQDHRTGGTQKFLILKDGKFWELKNHESFKASDNETSRKSCKAHRYQELMSFEVQEFRKYQN